MALTDLLRAYGTVFVAELPDKSMFAVLVLVARYRRPGWVWGGASVAFALHVGLAVLAGRALGLLPEAVVHAVVLVLFLAGAVLLVRAGYKAAAPDPAGDPVRRSSVRATVLGSFTVIALAEWGDLTQLATAGLVARGGSPLATGLGALAAEVSVAALAATIGRQLVTRVPIQRVNYLGAAIFGALAVWTAIDLVR